MCRPDYCGISALACCLALAPAAESCGEVLAFDYAGEVSIFGGATVFGFPISGMDPVAGRLTVDTAAAMTHDFGGGRLGYRQTIPAGLTAAFGSGGTQVDFVANEYLIAITNDFEGLFGRVDIVEFLFAADLFPPLTSPLVVNGVPRMQGDFNRDGTVDAIDYGEWRAQVGMSGASADGNGDGIVDAADYVIWRASRPIGLVSFEFHGPDSLFSSSSLAAANLAMNFNTTNFTSPFNLAGDGNNLVFFDVSTLALATPAALQVPEPWGLSVLMTGVTAFLSRRRKIRLIQHLNTLRAI